MASVKRDLINWNKLWQDLQFKCEPGSDWLRAGRSGDRIPVEVRFSAPVQNGPGAHPAYSKLGTGSFLGVKSGRGVTLTPHPLLVPLVMKEYSYTSTSPMGRTACTEPQCLYKGPFYLLPYLNALHKIENSEMENKRKRTLQLSKLPCIPLRFK